jgi:hypothetical protein
LFSGTITASVGQGSLELRGSHNPEIRAVVQNISVGEQTLTDTHVLETVVRGREVVVQFDRPLSPRAVLSYGSGPDGQGQPTLKGAENHAPVRMIFEKRVESSLPTVPSRGTSPSAGGRHAMDDIFGTTAPERPRGLRC